MKIESIHNEHIKYLKKLKEKKYRDEEGLFLVEGDHLVEEALKYGIVKEIISIDTFSSNIKNTLVSEQVMKSLSNQMSPSKIMAVVEKQKEKELKGTILFLDGIQDPGNLGTILRSAVAFKVSNIVLSNDTVDIYNEKVIRATEGMLFHLNILRRDTTSFLASLKEEKYQIYGTDVRDGEDVSQIDFPEKSCIIIGNEGKGMSNQAKSYTSKNIYIKMSKECESLNAGVAASIILYERSKHI